MAIVDERGYLFGRLNIVDAGLLVLGLLVLLGVGMVQSGFHATSSAMIQGEKPVLMTVFVRTRALNPRLFQAGEVTNITVRNQPRGEVSIVKVERQQVQTVVPQGSGVKMVADPTQPDVFDYHLTLKDTAIQTPEGFVANGVKIKVGLPVELEGFEYRLTGGIIKVEAALETLATTTPTPTPAKPQFEKAKQ
jgi:hypothetical protein